MISGGLWAQSSEPSIFDNVRDWLGRGVESLSISKEDKQATRATKDSSEYSTEGLQPGVRNFRTEQEAHTLAQDHTVVYFFAATWCSYCLGMVKDLRKNYGQIPSNVAIVLVNYDKDLALKKRYGVTQTGTYVVIDTQGKPRKIFTDSENTADLVKRATL